jgi:hypothetical protein
MMRSEKKVLFLHYISQNKTLLKVRITMPKKHKQYSIVSFFPERMTNKTLFMFYGGAFTEEEKANYILWFLTESRLFLDEWELDAKLDECEEEKKKNKYIDWNTCSRSFYKHLISSGGIEKVAA